MTAVVVEELHHGNSRRVVVEVMADHTVYMIALLIYRWQ